MLVGSSYLSMSVLLTQCCILTAKLIHNHIDWKSSHGETLQYAIKTVSKDNIKDNSFIGALSDIGLFYTSPCMYIDNCYIFTHTYHLANGSCAFSNTTCAPAVKANKEHVHRRLDLIDNVEWYAEIWERHRFKRRIHFNDKNYTDQWHLHKVNKFDKYGQAYLNVTGVWELGITGHNVTVAVVDDGLEWDNPDLRPNYNPAGSIDLNDRDNDPMPNEQNGKPLDHNEHGTRCAGEIAAVANNEICGVGIAYNARISGVRALDGSMTDLLERDAFAAKHDINDIYSCSWGPEDDGKTVDGPHTLAKSAIRNGILKGRKGYGSIYVVASGNGGSNDDNCNFDGYANSIYFVTIGAVDQHGRKPLYAEDCASMLAVTPSGDGNANSVVTTDVTHRPGSNGCTDKHSGTSAAAPLAAGVIALVLSVNPCLTWRDVQHLIVLSSVKIDGEDPDWKTNHAGLNHSHKHGFGLMSPWNIVNAAKVWKQVPVMSTFTKEDISISQPIITGEKLLLSYDVSVESLQAHNLNILEYVEVTVTITHRRRGDLKIELKCPNTEDTSVLASPRNMDIDSKKGFQGWTFSTARCWGERPAGQYQLIITDTNANSAPGVRTGTLSAWSLTLHGSKMSLEEYQQRINDVYEARSGYPLVDDIQIECKPPPVDIVEPQSSLPTKVLQIIVILGSFLTVAVIFNFIEDCIKKLKLSPDNANLCTNDQEIINMNEIDYQKINMNDLTVNIPIEDGAGDDNFQNVIANSNSDNEEEDSTLETTALLAPG